MKTYLLRIAAALLLAVSSAEAFGAFEEGVRVQADGEIIDVAVGHLVPCFTDWNADGKRDLIVGQFSGGKIRLYLNQGTDKEPVFKGFEFLKAGGAEISLPAG